MTEHIYVLRDHSTDYTTCVISDRELSRPELDLFELCLEQATAPTSAGRIALAAERYAGDTGIQLKLMPGLPTAVIEFR